MEFAEASNIKKSFKIGS